MEIQFTPSQIHPSSILARSNSIIDSEIDNEVVMMSLQAGQYFGLDPIGARIWQLLSAERSVTDLCEQLSAEYDVTPEQCEKDVLAFVDEMLANAILTVREPA